MSLTVRICQIDRLLRRQRALSRHDVRKDLGVSAPF